MDKTKVMLMLLEEYAGKPYGWNEGVGLPIRQDAYDIARHVLYDDVFPRRLVDLCQDSVLMNNDGTIEMALDHKGKSLLLTFQCGSAISYVRVYEDGETSTEGTLRILKSGDFGRAVCEIRIMIRWLTEEYA